MSWQSDRFLPPWSGGRWLLLVAALATQACQHVPLAPIDPAGNALRLQQRSLDDADVRTALASYGLPVPATSEWTLDQLTIAAWTLRTDIAVAAAELAAATVQVGSEDRRPTPSAGTSFERVTNAETDVKPWVVGASVGLGFETAGKRQIRRDRALAQQASLQWQLAQNLWQARSELGRALLAQVVADRRLMLDETELQLRRAYLDWVNSRLSQGAATTQERLIASEALSQIEGQRELDRAGLADATARFAAAVGVTPAEFSRVVPIAPNLDRLPEIDATDLAEARRLALTNRLDVRRALAEYEVAEQDLRAAIAAQYPDVVLGPGYLLDQGDHKITLNLDLPALMSKRTASAIDRAVALREVAARQFDQVQAVALAEIEASLVNYAAIRSAIDLVMAAERDAEQAQSSVRRRLEAGAADRGELIAADTELLLRRRNSLQTQVALAEAVMSLQDSIQQPLFPRSTITSLTEQISGL